MQMKCRKEINSLMLKYGHCRVEMHALRMWINVVFIQSKDTQTDTPNLCELVDWPCSPLV